jgi:DNA-binding CsgD family transcriptional regulator
MQLWKLLAEGLSNEAIADAMGITINTVQLTIGRVYEELEITGDRAINRRVVASVKFYRKVT